MTADLSAAFLGVIAEFAGTFANPVAAVAVVAMAWLIRRRATFRLAGALLGAGLGIPAAWSEGEPLAAAAVLIGGTLGVLLQVEFMLGVVLPILAGLRRLRDMILGLFRTPTLPPRP